MNNFSTNVVLSNNYANLNGQFQIGTDTFKVDPNGWITCNLSVWIGTDGTVLLSNASSNFTISQLSDFGIEGVITNGTVYSTVDNSVMGTFSNGVYTTKTNNSFSWFTAGTQWFAPNTNSVASIQTYYNNLSNNTLTFGGIINNNEIFAGTNQVGFIYNSKAYSTSTINSIPLMEGLYFKEQFFLANLVNKSATSFKDTVLTKSITSNTIYTGQSTVATAEKVTTYSNTANDTLTRLALLDTSGNQTNISFDNWNSMLTKYFLNSMGSNTLSDGATLASSGLIINSITAQSYGGQILNLSNGTFEWWSPKQTFDPTNLVAMLKGQIPVSTTNFYPIFAGTNSFKCFIFGETNSPEGPRTGFTPISLKSASVTYYKNSSSLAFAFSGTMGSETKKQVIDKNKTISSDILDTNLAQMTSFSSLVTSPLYKVL